MPDRQYGGKIDILEKFGLDNLLTTKIPQKEQHKGRITSWDKDSIKKMLLSKEFQDNLGAAQKKKTLTHTYVKITDDYGYYVNNKEVKVNLMPNIVFGMEDSLDMD
jgi:hypothetical protein